MQASLRAMSGGTTHGSGAARGSGTAHGSGGCLCGAVRYEVDGPLRDVVICHCSRCLRTHGHAAAYSACAAADLTLVRDDGLRWYEADGRARGFCARCGASIFWSRREGDTMSLAAGTLDQ